jgi:predicted PurR-regulated permease PerM
VLNRVAGMALVLVFVWYAADLLLLVFAGILVSILLRGLSRFVTQKTGLGRGLLLALISLAGLLNFVPNFGPVIAALPAVLIAFLQGPQHALYVALLYVTVQMLDGYLLTPLVDRRGVELPPALTISAQVLLGLLFGFVGLLVASPLAATVMLLVKMLYIEDVLGDPIMQESVVGERDMTAQRIVSAVERHLPTAQGRETGIGLAIPVDLIIGDIIVAADGQHTQTAAGLTACIRRALASAHKFALYPYQQEQ